MYKRQEENQRREFVLWVVNQDPAIKEIGDKVTIRVSLGQDGLVSVESGDIPLSEATLSMLKNDPAVMKLSQPVEIDIQDGKAQLVTPRTMEDALRVDVYKRQIPCFRGDSGAFRCCRSLCCKQNI